MKKLVWVAVLFSARAMWAQTTVDLPVFSEKTVIMKEVSSAEHYIIVTDGVVKFSDELEETQYGYKKEADSPNLEIIANILNQLKEQGYKLISVTQYSAYKHYYFQKD